MCYKQKCKVVSLNLANPVYYIIVVNCGLLRNILVKLVKFWFCFLIATIFGE